MHYERKNLTTTLVATVLLLAMVLCFALSVTYATADSNEPAAIADAGIATTALSDGDYSSYTDKELPDTISRSNIAQYVPTEKFNTDRYLIYNGRNYGFIIFNDARTNHVLLFKEIITKTSSDNFEVEFKVVYTNAFFKTGNTIMNANSPYDIALSNFKFSEFIIDTEISESVTSPYFTSAGLSGEISFLNKSPNSDNVAISMTDVNPVAKSDKSIANKVEDITINSINGREILTSTKLGEISPLVSDDQTLQRCIELQMDAGADDFLANKNGEQDYYRASFEVSGTTDKDYYVYNNISFDICLYNSLQVKKEVRIFSDSVYSPTDNSTSEYGILDRSGDGYSLREYQRFEPMLNNLGVFNFAPDKDRDYKITTPDGYYATIDGAVGNLENVFAVSGQNNAVGFTSEIGKLSNLGTHGERLIAQDFIGGELKFANIAIQRAQELKFNDTYLDAEIPTYRTVKTDQITNNLFTLDILGYVGVITLHILDEELNIIQTSTRYGNELVINYPLSADKKYYIVCDNLSYTSQALQFNDKGVLNLEDKSYAGIENLYYRYTVPKYTQYYQTFAKQIIDEQSNVISTNYDDALLESGKTYYLQAGISRLMTRVSSSHIKNITKLNETIVCSQELNDAFEFVAKVSAQYNFDGGTYDVYRNWTLIAEDVDSIYLNESEIAYQFVKRQQGGIFALDIQGEELRLGLNNLSLSSLFKSTSYIFNADEKMRIEYTTYPEQNVYIYDANLNLLEYDRGYPLSAGKNYIIIEGTGSATIMIEEYLQKVDVDLYVDGEKYDYNMDFYYGKDLILPVPVKDRHNFVGWSDGNALVTDSNGQGLTEILQDSMTLTAVWQLRGIIIKFASHDVFWWNGNAMVKNYAGRVLIDADIDTIYAKVLSAIRSNPECIEPGYYTTSYQFELTSSDALDDYYTLSVSAKVKERYKIVFDILGEKHTMNMSVAFGDKITNSYFPKAVFATSNKEYAITGWSLEGSDKIFTITLGESVEDFTPGRGSNNGSLGYTEVYLTANIQYVTYRLNINDALYELPRNEEYRFEMLEAYGYDASKYYGHNVSFQTSKGEVYYIDDTVSISDFYVYWSSGMTDVTVNIEFVTKAIKVNINYVLYLKGKQIVPERNDNRDYYSGGTAYKLSEAVLFGWGFYGWRLNGNLITQLDYPSLEVTKYYSTADDIELDRELTSEFTAHEIYNLKSGTHTLDFSIDCVRIYGNESGSYNHEFIITSSINQVTFVGGKWYDTCIVEESMEGGKILFDNVYIKAKNNRSALYTEMVMPQIYSFNTVELVAGDVTAKGAQPAIYAERNIMFGGETFIIRGGNSTDAYITASYGIRCCNVMFSLAKNMQVYGGNGAKGIDGTDGGNGASHQQQNGGNGGYGGYGGHGVVAIYANSIGLMTKNSQITFYGGNGGDGGNGGNGGKGSDGKDGSVGVYTVDPGNGGNGGNGGIGGYGSIAAWFKEEPATHFPDSSNIYYVPGTAGAAGLGGKAGSAGAPSKTIWGNYRYGSAGAVGVAGEQGVAGENGYKII